MKAIIISAVFCLVGFKIGIAAYPEVPAPIKYVDKDYEVLHKQYKWVSPKLYAAIKQAATENNIPAAFIAATIRFESYSYKLKTVNPRAKGPKIKKLKGMRALGLMQVMPLNYKGNANDLLIPEINIKVGSKYLAYCYRKANGDLYEATKNYNSGPNSKFYNHPHLIDVTLHTLSMEIMKYVF